MSNSRASQPAGDILIVDDDLSSLRFLSDLLSEDGYQVRGAHDGSTTLMIAAADPPDLILLDVRMPVMDGFEVCHRLKRNEGTRAIPVIFVSGLDETVDKVQGFEAGGIDYITKPYRIEEVKARVKTHLTLHQLRAALDQRNTELQHEVNARQQTAETLQTRTEELRARVTELSAINRVAQIVAATIDLDEALARVAATVTDLFAVRAAFISVVDSEDGTLEIVSGFEAQSGPYAAPDQPMHLAEMPISRRVLASGEPESVANVQALPLSDAVRAIVAPLSLQTMMFMPLKMSGKIIGLLTLASDDPGRSFTWQETTLAETIAGDVASAIESVRLAEQARMAAVDAERQRLARELHDSVTQSLYSLTLLASGWKSMAAQGTLTDPAASFQQLGDVGQQALKEMRLLIHQLRPAELEELGLAQSIQRRLDAVELRAGIEPRLCIEGDVESVPDSVADQLFFIAQEALNNSLRHAHATKVNVHLHVDEQTVLLEVMDNGLGFDPSAETAGMGLVIMSERADSMHGELVIESSPERGSTIKAYAPMAHMQRADTPRNEEQA